MNRRQFLKAGFALSSSYSIKTCASLEPSLQQTPIKIGLTPVFLDDQVAFLRRWQVYLEKHLSTPVAFVQRNAYQPVIDMLMQRQIDFAWICGYPYIENQHRLELISVPSYKGKHTYQAYIIVHHQDQEHLDIESLKDTIFAYSDPNSNSGYLYPQYLLHQKKMSDAFKKSFFTFSHRKTIEVISEGLAQAGAVDGYVWDTMQLTHAHITQQTQIIHRSSAFGFPPIVAHNTLSTEKKMRFSEVLHNMHNTEDGNILLKSLNLTKFDTPDDHLFDSIRTMAAAVKDKRYD